MSPVRTWLVIAAIAAALASPAAASAQPLHIFEPPPFLRLDASIERLPRAGVVSSIRARCTVENTDRLWVTFAAIAPPGVAAVPATTSGPILIERGRPLDFSYSVSSSHAEARGILTLTAHAPFPATAVRRYYWRRLALYSDGAQRDFDRVMRNPPKETVATASIRLSTPARR